MKGIHVCVFALLLALIQCSSWITYDQLRGKPYKEWSTILDQHQQYGKYVDVFQKAKEEGLNTIQTYVFWNAHEKIQGQEFDFEFNNNLPLFLKTAADMGLFVNLRLGPYVCAEWTNGGLPLWLTQLKGMSYRSYTQPWMDQMENFSKRIMKAVEPYLARNGGPIILSQIDNELNSAEQEYVDWCGALTERLNVDIPWIMCNGQSANNTINAINSCLPVEEGKVEDHYKRFPTQPFFLTENEGWFQDWSAVRGVRSPQEVALSVLSFIASGGSYHAYYMWHGGNHYGNTAAGGLTNAYADDVNLRADGTPNQPKHAHLTRIHNFCAKYADLLLSQDRSHSYIMPWWNKDHWENGTQQLYYQYGQNNKYLYFLYNGAPISIKTLFKGREIIMNKRSVVVMDESLQVLMDTSVINQQDLLLRDLQPAVVVSNLKWSTWSEPTGELEPQIGGITAPVFKKERPVELLQAALDNHSDYHRLWYRSLVQSSPGSINITFDASRSTAFMLFINGSFISEWNHPRHSYYEGTIKSTISFNLRSAGLHLVEILSVNFGVANDNHKNHFDTKGLTGSIYWNEKDITNNGWYHQLGLLGEIGRIYEKDIIKWDDNVEKSAGKALTWYKAQFDLSDDVVKHAASNPVHVHVEGLQRGHIYVNNFDIGMYWTLKGDCKISSTPCSVTDTSLCDKPTQIMYHIPPEVLKSTGNVIIVIEELGAPSIHSVNIIRKV
ncbi:beta-galactosidase [Acrasis kona]|uniref:Beta-galactosidase n=1 Tax=Acrasis kona TaxID=1008807 RepID=A0AAW2Z5I0_9EUKA